MDFSCFYVDLPGIFTPGSSHTLGKSLHGCLQ